MKDKKEILKKLKEEKDNPGFIRQEINRRNNIDEKWRNPKGTHSKVRKEEKGAKPKVKTGYGRPKEKRGTLPNGKQPVRITKPSDLKEIKKETQAVIISSKVGKRKKIQIVQKAQEKEIPIHNIENPEEYLENIQEEMEERKQKRKEREQKKEQRKEEAKKEEKDEEDEEKEETKEQKQPSMNWLKDDLKQYAKDKQIEIKSSDTKKDILEKIQEKEEKESSEQSEAEKVMITKGEEQ